MLKICLYCKIHIELDILQDTSYPFYQFVSHKHSKISRAHIHFIYEQTEAKWQTCCLEFSVVFTVAGFTIDVENLFSETGDINLEREQKREREEGREGGNEGGRNGGEKRVTNETDRSMSY